MRIEENTLKAIIVVSATVATVIHICVEHDGSDLAVLFSFIAGILLGHVGKNRKEGH